MIDRDILINSWEIFRDKMFSVLTGKGEMEMPELKEQEGKTMIMGGEFKMKKPSRLEEGREIVQVKLNEDGANTELDDDMMTIDDFIQELNIAIKQDGHDIYMKRDDATMIKQIIINHSNIVRCKDCKFLPSSSPGCSMFCERIHNFVDADWFCADGKRRTDDD